MKKRFTMILAAVLIMGICGLTIVMPAFANSGIDSRGNILFEDADVAFYASDIENLNAKMSVLSADMGNAAYAALEDKQLKNDLKSKGIINYDSGKVIFDSQDLIKLADGIDNLNVGYKSLAVSALNAMHTYFKEDGSTTHDDKASGLVPPDNASKLAYSDICTGILNSQSVEHLANQNVTAASADNLSEGSAAWVNGELLIGTGFDNKASYDKGFNAGYASKSDICCYYLGTSDNLKVDGKIYCEIYNKVPEVDYKQLSNENFIVCPYKIDGNRNDMSKFISASLAIGYYCEIDETKINIKKEYDAQDGTLTITLPTISANGGISTFSDYTATAESSIGVYVYLVTGRIVDRSK